MRVRKAKKARSRSRGYTYYWYVHREIALWNSDARVPMNASMAAEHFKVSRSAIENGIKVYCKEKGLKPLKLPSMGQICYSRLERTTYAAAASMHESGKDHTHIAKILDCTEAQATVYIRNHYRWLSGPRVGEIWEAEVVRRRQEAAGVQNCTTTTDQTGNRKSTT